MVAPSTTASPPLQAAGPAPSAPTRPPAPAYRPPDAPLPARCSECDAALVGPYCAQCGQRAAGADDLTLRRFVRGAAEEVSGTDARLVQSLWTLVRHPGRLTREYADGHRRRWASPVQLFLLTSASYFFVGLGATLAATDARAQLRAQLLASVGTLGRGTSAARRAAADALAGDAVYNGWVELQAWGKFANLVGLAAVVWALYRKRVRGGVVPVTFALHYYAFDFLLFAATGPLLLLAARLHGGPLPQSTTLLLIPLYVAYVYVALRRVFGDTPARAGVRTAALVATDFLLSVLTSALAFAIILGRVVAGKG